MEDQRPATRDHISEVKKFLYDIIDELRSRAIYHDESKLESPEREIFDEYTPKLRDTTYGSYEYKGFLKEMKVALDHHYAANRHHPEHFSKVWQCDDCGEEYAYSPDECRICAHVNCFSRKADLNGMNLIDIIEMLCDWKAATMRHTNGDIIRSVEFNQDRFKYSDELKAIFLNTIMCFK